MLSVSEVNNDYIKNAHNCEFEGEYKAWWLRSPWEYYNNAQFVYANVKPFSVGHYGVSYDGFVVRPAFNLDSSKILFTFAANGKNTADGYQLTMKDESRKDFTVEEKTASEKAGETLSFNYDNAKTGNNEYISAMLVNKYNREILYYEQLSAAETKKGTVDFTIPSDIDEGSYDLYLFNEQVNGDYKTDYSSDFQTVDLSVERPKAKFKELPTAKTGLVYNNAEQALVTAGKTDNGTVRYKISDNGMYSTQIPKAKDAGTYKVWYYVKGSGNYLDSDKDYVEVTIEPKDITDAYVELGADLTYDGTEQTKQIEEVSIDNLTLAEDDYTVTGNTGTEAGDGYELTVTGKGNFKGFVKKAFEIKKADAKAPDNLTAFWGQKLSDVNLPAGWEWATPADSVGDVGTNNHKANYAGNNNINSASDVNVPVKVAKATINGVSFDVTKPKAGDVPQDTVLGGTGYTAEIKWSPNDQTFGFNTAYTATVTLTADDNHEFASGISVNGWNVKSANGKVLTFEKTFENTEKQKLTALLSYPADWDLTEYYTNVDSVIEKLSKTVLYQIGIPGTGGGVKEAEIEWSCDNFNSDMGAPNEFTWNVKAGELADYDASGVETSDSVIVTNSSAVGVTHVKHDEKTVYDGKTYDVSGMFTKGTTTATPSYEVVAGGTGEGTLSGTDLTIKKAGTIKIKMSTAADGQYASGSVIATLTVEKGIGAATAKIADWTYGESASSPVIASETNGTKNVSYMYKVKDSDDGTYQKGMPENAGEYTLKATFAATDLYGEVVKTADFKILQRGLTPTVSGTASKVYDGTLKIPDGHSLKIVLDGVLNGDDVSADASYEYGGADVGTTAINATILKLDGGKNANYKLITDTVSANVGEIKPYTPTESKSTTARVRKDGTLAEAAVTNGEILGVGGVPIYGTFAWLDGTKVISADATEQMTFTPTDKNYAPITVSVAVSTYVSSGGGGTPSYTVKFDTNGANAVTTQKVTKNSKATEPKEPTKEGYAFGGWYTDGNFETEYDFSTKVTKNITLYAKWVEEKTEEPSDGKKDDEPQAGEWKNPFIDVKENDWYFESLKYVNENGLMGGTTDSTFEPNGNLTRAMLVTVLYRAAGEPAVNKSIPFADVKAESYYKTAVIWAQQNGIVSGVSENEFAPDENITREQIATIIYRYAIYKGIAPKDAWTIKLDYADVGEISDYAVLGVMYCTMKNIMNGKGNNMFAPKDNATRAEITAIIQRFIETNK